LESSLGRAGKMVLNLPCKECVSRECEKRKSCKNVDKLLGTGNAWPKRRTFSVDVRKIEESSDALNDFQLSVLRAIGISSSVLQERCIDRFALEELTREILNEREALVIQLFLEGYKQKEIAEKLGVSQQRTSFRLKRAVEKIHNFFKKSVVKTTDTASNH
jgi:RNA polymerase sigma factor (sigma-70 family)